MIIFHKTTHSLIFSCLGVATFRQSKVAPFTTNFVFPITSAMSFNRSLWYKTGSQIAHEARALSNSGELFKNSFQ